MRRRNIHSLVVALLSLMCDRVAFAEDPSERFDEMSREAAEVSRRALAGFDHGASIVDGLRSIPVVEAVTVVGKDATTRTIIQLRDYHFVTRDVFEASMRSVGHKDVTDERYERFLLDVEKVQAEQIAFIRCLIEHRRLREVFVEGLTPNDLRAFEAKVAVLKKVDRELTELRADLLKAETEAANADATPEDVAAAQELIDAIESLFRRQRLDLLRIGAAGRLVVSGDLDDVVPLEDADAFREADPVGIDGTVAIDPINNERREDEQVQTLLACPSSLKVVVLGGGHDLSDNLRRQSEPKHRYISVTTKRYQAVAH